MLFPMPNQHHERSGTVRDASYLCCQMSLQFIGVLIIYSRIAEVDYEIKYGEKKDLSQWASRANLLDRSGVNTPTARTPGTRTPVG